MVIGTDNVAEGRKPLFNPLDLDFIGDCIAKMLKFLVCGRGRDEKAFTIADAMSDEAR